MINEQKPVLATDDTLQDRKPWRTPIVIVGELEDAEVNININSDGVIGS